jgi:hypothetical protein
MSWGRQPWGVIGGAGGDDGTPPTVVFNPTTGTPIARNRVLQVTVTDLFLKRVQLTAEFPSGAWETIYMQDRFATAYNASTVQAVSGGFTFYLRRSGGWLATPKIHVDAYDTSANET